MPERERVQNQVSHFRSRLEWFIHSEATGSILLLACTVVALAWANSPWADTYFHLLHTPVGLSWDSSSFSLSLHDWINDGLMAVFFFVVGLEIKLAMVIPVRPQIDPRQFVDDAIARLSRLLEADVSVRSVLDDRGHLSTLERIHARVSRSAATS